MLSVLHSEVPGVSEESSSMSMREVSAWLSWLEQCLEGKYLCDRHREDETTCRLSRIDFSGRSFYAVSVVQKPYQVTVYGVPDNRLVTTVLAMLSAPELFTPRGEWECIQFSLRKVFAWSRERGISAQA
jgi:beta-glucosidase/6-phospho-beta-glucosidase/beta-galactosidase